MKGVVRKWGNSAAVRIPAVMMKAIGLDLDDVVEIREEDGRIVIEPAVGPTYALEELVKGISEENRHEAAEFGGPVGGEVW